MGIPGRPQLDTTKEQIIAEISRVRATLPAGAKLTRANYRPIGQIAEWQIRKVFGSFSAAAEAARTQENLAGLKGHLPQMHINAHLPDFLKIKGTSQLMKRGEEEPLLSWVKTNTDQEKLLELLRGAVEALADDIPRAMPMPMPAASRADLLNCYVVTDYHLGMLAWREETRDADYDLKIAEKQLVDWFAAAIAMAPDAEIGVFAQLGDFLHFDGLEAVTPTSRHVLDADTRFQKVVRVAIRVVRQVVDMLLAKHPMVHLILAEGNHDMASSVWLRELFSAMYENEPRISVDRSPDPYYCIEHGATSLFFHHGHKRKMGALDDVLVAKFRQVFGRTQHSYAHTGHLHHVEVKETNLMIVEQHRTLAPSDAHASRGGWMSGRDAKVITYSSRFGEVGRITVSPAMLATA